MVQAAAGNIIYLLKDGDKLSAGYKLQLAATAAPSAPPAGEPPGSGAANMPQKRSRPAANHAAAVGSSDQPQAAEAATAAPGYYQQVFAGVHLVVWDNSHTQQAVSLAVQAGAVVQRCVDAATTHVIAR